MAITFNSTDPRTNHPGPAFMQATLADVDAAVNAAATAFASPELADPARRAAALRDAAARLRARGDEIVAVAESETGLPQVPRLRGELERTCVQLELHADACASGEHLDAIIDHADPDAAPVPRPDVRRVNVPIGVVAVFGASNFPLAFSTAGGDTASALAAGCPVVVKGHPLHPGTGELVAAEVTAACAAAGLPAGTFTHLLAYGYEVGEALVDHPGVAAVAFTGSARGGRALMDRAAARANPIPVFAEMGSLNPVVITAGALSARGDALADALTASICSFGGQLCTKPGLVFTPDGAFADALESRFAQRGDEVLLSAGIAAAFVDGTGAEIVDATHVRPVLLRTTAGALVADDRLREEHFGPGVVVVVYAGAEDLSAALASLGGHLTATLHAEPAELPSLRPLVTQLTGLAGRVLFDGVPTGVAVTWAMVHGGPYPATSAPASTSVGQTAARRFLRPVAYQSAPAEVLPAALADGNPLGILRRVDGIMARA
jgi:acyl-CoA reductase-like NAD-dependent aldehyde dehydrogenase